MLRIVHVSHLHWSLLLLSTLAAVNVCGNGLADVGRAVGLTMSLCDSCANSKTWRSNSNVFG